MSSEVRPRLLRLADVPATPWRNGGGVTHELLAAPAGDWRWRLSVAVIAADGPFSAFPGVERWFGVIEGSGVELDIEGYTLSQRQDDPPLRFDGASGPACRLIDGPTRDLNLMLRGTRGSMARAVPAARWQPGSQQAGVYSRTPCRVSAEQAVWELPSDALLWFNPAPDGLRVDADQPLAAWWIAVDSPAEPR